MLPAAVPVNAQEINGTPGSPEATQSINGHVLPAPYGFVGGDTSQWEPNLFRNTTAVYPYIGNPGWNLTTAMADASKPSRSRYRQ